MSLNVQIPPDAEFAIRRAARRAGIPLAEFLRLAADQEEKRGKPSAALSLAGRESEILLEIGSLMGQFDWPRFHILSARMEDEELSEAEHQELVAMTRRIEAANAHRIRLLAELSRLRHVEIDDLIAELELNTPHHG